MYYSRVNISREYNDNICTIKQKSFKTRLFVCCLRIINTYLPSNDFYVHKKYYINKIKPSNPYKTRKTAVCAIMKRFFGYF